ncbi:hypothetical protein HAX54_010588 [Datura stramonium]|uniref:Hexosyltransferase n=1 Tax=Datura stramonium TaxID=4076 RepID=A0ABS8TGJ1_DATST|nr:hypothetical protein [Datura stramonium]
MPSSPKSFTPLPSSFVYSRRSKVLILVSNWSSCLCSVSLQFRGRLWGLMQYAEPDLFLLYDKTGSEASGEFTGKDTGLSDEGQKRHKIMGFVGIQTGFASTGRRRSLRQTWLGRLCHWLGLGVCNCIAFFFKAAMLYDSEFYVKADDYRAFYVRYEPLGYMLGKEYFLHAYGPIYALSAEVVTSLVALRNNSFRMFSNEDVTIGSWMLAMNVNHEDNRQLCQADCTPSSIAVWDIPKCSGLCNPEKKMLELHAKDACSKSPTLPSDEDD